MIRPLVDAHVLKTVPSMQSKAYNMTETSFDEFSASEQRSMSDKSDVSFKSPKFESLADFEKWLARDERRLEEGNVGSIQSHIHASNATYILEEASTPLKRWRCVIDDSPKRCRRRCYERGARRGGMSSEDMYVSPKYIEPWYWKGTSRRPYRRYDQDEEDESGSSTFMVIVGIVIFIVVVVLLVKNKKNVQGWFNLSQYFSNDFADVKERVEGEVKDMIGNEFNEVSWKYEDQPETNVGRDFENAIEENDPTVVEHIKSFEEHLKRKPGKFFPSGKMSAFMPINDDNE